MSTLIHPTAVISPGAELGVDVQIGPYTVVGPAVTIGDRTRVGPQVVIDGVTSLGTDNIIVGQANLGGAPQDFSYQGEPTQLTIGDGNTIREFVTINRGTIKGGGLTSLGSHCLLMACSHVAHDCELEDHVILGNNVMLAGHVLVEHHANLSGGSGAHHFCTVGRYAYVGAMTRMLRDAPPFMIVEGHASRVRGVNIIGLQRDGMKAEDIDQLRQIFKRIFRSGDPRRRVLDELGEMPDRSEPVSHLIDSMRRTEIGLKGRYRETLREEFTRMGVARILENSEAE
ncbi:MAG: UDP-N-acetylglucosamine acyltransferase [Chlamydiales bacterium]|jgi:UDP-N-acetylglucosamine acyltransferase